MLTVKLVEPSGHEQIYEAKRVWSDRAPGSAGACLVMAETADGNTLSFGTYGDVYVMNGHGSTVGAYYLGNGDQPAAAVAPVAAPSAIAA